MLALELYVRHCQICQTGKMEQSRGDFGGRVMRVLDSREASSRHWATFMSSEWNLSPISPFHKDQLRTVWQREIHLHAVRHQLLATGNAIWRAVIMKDQLITTGRFETTQPKRMRFFRARTKKNVDDALRSVRVPILDGMDSGRPFLPEHPPYGAARCVCSH